MALKLVRAVSRRFAKAKAGRPPSVVGGEPDGKEPGSVAGDASTADALLEVQCQQDDDGNVAVVERRDDGSIAEEEARGPEGGDDARDAPPVADDEEGGAAPGDAPAVPPEALARTEAEVAPAEPEQDEAEAYEPYPTDTFLGMSEARALAELRAARAEVRRALEALQVARMLPNVQEAEREGLKLELRDAIVRARRAARELASERRRATIDAARRAQVRAEAEVRRAEAEVAAALEEVRRASDELERSKSREAQ